MAAIRMRHATARVVIGGVAVVVIVLAVVLWPHPKPAAEAASSPPTDITPVSGLPQGAMECSVIYPEVQKPFNAGARGTPMTTCAFVEQVRRAYAATGDSAQISVVSPATRKMYNVACFTTGDYATCTGGQGALIYLYNAR